MAPAHRIALLVCGIALAAVTFTLGASFTHAAESASNAEGAWVFWLLVGFAVASPFWLPALVPTRFVLLSRIVRWASAILVLVPLRYIAGVLLHQYHLYGGDNFAPSIFGGALLLSAGCAFAIVVLVLPELRRKVAPFA
jgi:hypothetical protein